MICKRCLNRDKNYFYKGAKGYYCRKCIGFKRLLVEEELSVDKLDDIKADAGEYLLPYPLTSKQKNISELCLKYVLKSDVLINAVCGSGKTEIVLKTIAYFLKNNKKVCFAISRRQVVIELSLRLQKIFNKAKVTAICAGYTKILDGDLIVCTTHQCYRFYKVFDLLILDEPDAFPYKGNEILKNIVKTSCKGNMIYLTATLDDYLKYRIIKNDIKVLKLNKRPHGYDLIVPKVEINFRVILLFKLFKWLKKHQNEINLVFVPSIKKAENLYYLLKFFYKCGYCHSKTENKDQIIEDFKKGKINILIATTILERGVTINNVNVCVFNASHKVFDEASLIQISGRVGRSFAYPYGDCLFLSDNKSEAVDKCVLKVKEANNE